MWAAKIFGLEWLRACAVRTRALVGVNGNLTAGSCLLLVGAARKSVSARFSPDNLFWIVRKLAAVESVDVIWACGGLEVPCDGALLPVHFTVP